MHKLHELYRKYRHLGTLNNGVLAVAVVIALSWVWGSVDALQRNYALQQQVDAGRAQNDLLSLENENLQAQQAYLNSNEYLELAARDKLNLALPGEKLLILPHTSEQTSPSQTATALSAPPSNLSQWISFLLGSHTR